MRLMLSLIITSRKETTRRRSKNRYNETIDFSRHEYSTKVDFVYQRKCTQCYKDHCMFKPRIISLFSYFLDFTTRSRVLPIVNLIIVPSHNGFLIYFFIFILARRQPMFNQSEKTSLFDERKAFFIESLIRQLARRKRSPVIFLDIYNDLQTKVLALSVILSVK